MNALGVTFPTTSIGLWLVAETVALVLIWVALRRFESLRMRRIEAFVSADLAPRLLLGYDVKMRRPLTWLSFLGFAFLGLAIAQPHWGRSWQEVQQSSRDIIVCLDVSQSMQATDLLPNRLERAKQKISAMVDAAPGDRFGLVAFAGAAALECPLTIDHGYFKAVLNAIDSNSISREGTEIASAMEEAEKALREEGKEASGQSKEYRAVVLVSDGEDATENAVEMAKKLSQFARIYVLGVGDPRGGEVKPPTWMSYYRSAGNLPQSHISRLDEDKLSKIALDTDGRYVRSTPDNFDVERIMEHLKGVAGRTVESDIRFRQVNRYQWPLALATLCFAGEGIWLVAMPWVRRRRMRRAEVPAAAEKQHA
jgi:Ca-activated chloride channel family protein